MRTEVVDSITALDAAAWNRLNSRGYPFLRHEFLGAAERTGCVSAETGWQPRHVALFDTEDALVAALPLYQKSHSWGEFVFDWAWARAYAQAGLPYYPKLVSASPFTPATSHRLLSGTRAPAEVAPALIERALALADADGLSSLHVQFPSADELPALQQAGLKLRKDCQFHWHNHGYRSFDDFLAAFSSRKRKKAKRDRRAVAEQGIRFRWLHGADMTESLWQAVYGFISMTFLRRGSMPYLDLGFFREIAASMPNELLVVLAEQHGHPIAAALFFVGPDTLYGRYWGSESHHNALHFETCYYQGIDYCIAHGLQTFEPGTQGEHKISRGFTPVTTWSAHWLAHPQFFNAVGDYLDQEQRYVDRYIDAVDAHSPYRQAGDGRRR